MIINNNEMKSSKDILFGIMNIYHKHFYVKYIYVWNS